MNGKRGSTSVEKAAIIILLVIFLLVAFLIVTNVLHFSIPFLSGIGTNLNNNPAPCSISYVNTSYATPGSCQVQISASQGTIGLTYSVYENTSSTPLGSYVTGQTTFSENLTLPVATKGVSQYFEFYCDTAGSTQPVDGNKYNSGGTAEVMPLC